MLHSRDFDTPELDEIELGHLYERALERSAQLRVRRARRRFAAGGAAALACLLAVGLVTASLAGTTPGRRTVAGSAVHQTGTAWRLVSYLSTAGSSWQKLSPSDYEQTFSLVCPSGTTCYAGSIGGQLEYTHDGGSSWQRATAVGTATSLPQISCVNAQDCNVLAEISGRGSTFFTTTDGGQSWSSEPGPALPAISLEAGPGASPPGLAMSCATTSSCVVIAQAGASSGSYSEVFRTSDGGASWSRTAFPHSGSRVFVPSGLSCSGTTCITVGSFGLWQSRSGPGGSAQGFRNEGGAAYTSDNGGATWSASSVPPGAGVMSLTCPDATDCYAMAFTAVYRTTDGGQAWSQVATSGLRSSVSGGNFDSISCAASSSCWLAGAGAPASRPTNSRTQHFVSIAQAKPLLASTADGGATWTVSSVPAGVGGLLDVTCPDTSTCFALGAEQDASAPGHMEVVLLTNAS